MQSFIDSGADRIFMADNAVKELISVKIKDGPIPLGVASGKTINATGEVGALIPLANGRYQAIRALTLKRVTREYPDFDL